MKAREILVTLLMCLVAAWLIGEAIEGKQKPVLYRIERYTYKNGKNTSGHNEFDFHKMECVDHTESGGCEAYWGKYDSILAGNMGYDSVIFVIVKQ